MALLYVSHSVEQPLPSHSPLPSPGGEGGDGDDGHDGHDEEDICREQAVVGLMEWRFQVAISAPQRHTCYKHVRH